MNDFKALIELATKKREDEWILQNINQVDILQEYDKRIARSSYGHAAALPNELLLEALEALQWLLENAEHCTVGLDRVDTYDKTEETINKSTNRLKGI